MGVLIKIKCFFQKNPTFFKKIYKLLFSAKKHKKTGCFSLLFPLKKLPEGSF